MKHLLKTCLLTLGVVPFLVGCGAKDNTPVPTPLVKIKSSLPAKMIWSQSATDGAGKSFLNLGPAVGSKMLVTVDKTGKIVALNPATGQKLWQVNSKADISATPTIFEGQLFVGTLSGKLLSISMANGKVVWTANLSSSLLLKPVVENGVVVVHTHNDSLLAFDANSGQELWHFDNNTPPLMFLGGSVPAIYHGLVISGFSNGEVIAFDLQSGQQKWAQPVAMPSGNSMISQIVGVMGKIIIKDGVVYAVTTNGNVAAMEAQDGHLIWQHPLSSYVGLAVANSNVFVVDAKSDVYALAQKTGRVLWKNPAYEARSLTAPVVVGGYLLVGDYDGYVHWLSASTGKILARTKVGDSAITARPVVYENTAYVTTNKGKVAAIVPFGK